ncbi:efflux RND transporter permease subunit [Bacillus sp. FJAT-29790]|uniref:efflux RND transporter permease subunit n=1 Tax=Bacillus sp. FJAT-29790 TaxID=1895002 RepID=UPI001C2142C0|nr:efflux RND transporter permease subunit [Bacillus sp. FJAT-29790]MBU8880370.1 efflux RND transporter permease subunit [Bacillus sp. FJAT-29790]
MGNLLKISLKNTVAIMILVVLVIAGGVYSTNKIKVETFPNVSFPALFVQAVYMNHSAAELEEQLTKPLEDSIKQQRGYDTLSSTSSNNMASISIMYPFGTDMDEQKAKLEDAMNKVKLPDGAKVDILQFNSGAMPVYEVALAEKTSDPNLQSAIEDNLVPSLEKIEGVGTVSIKGEKKQNVSIVVDQEKAKLLGITLQNIKDAIQAKNYKVSLGQVKDNGTNIPLEMEGSINRIDDLKEIEVSGNQLNAMTNRQPSLPQGFKGSASQAQKVKLSNIAKIDSVTEQSEISRFNGKESFLLAITKTQDANTAEVVNNVKDKIDSFKKEHDFTLYTVQDQGKEVEKSISSLLNEGRFGVLFTILVILLFLRNIRATLIAMISLPVSILATIALLNQFDYTLNIMTLGGLAVAIGRIVDDSIVVMENIFRWRQEKGKELSVKQAALHATKEVLGAVTSSTLATLVVFLPLAFVSGIIGEFFRPFALSVVFSISVSLIVALFLIPVLGSSFFKNIKHVEKKSKLVNVYEKLLRASLNKKPAVIILSIVLLFGSLALIPKLGVAFLPAGESSAIQAQVKLSSSLSIEKTDLVAKEIESFLDGKVEIDHSQVSLGMSNNPMMMMEGGSDNNILFYIQLKDGQKADLLLDDYQKNIQDIVQKQYEDATVTVSEVQNEGPPSGNSVDVQLFSSDLNKLSEASNQVEALLKQNKHLKNIQSNLKDEQTKWRLVINENGKEADVQFIQLMQAINEYLWPVTVGEYELNGNAKEVTLSYDKQITSKDDINNIEINTVAGRKKVSEVADIKESKDPVTIYHEDGKTLAKVSAVIKGNDTAKVTNDVKKDIDSLTLPNGVDVSIGGGMEMINTGFADLGMAMGAAIGLVFLVLSVTFGGILTPLVILSSLIFVPIGALGGLLISGQSLSMSALIGMLMLIGIVVTNAVVLLDRVEKNRINGMELLDAVIEAAKTRLRPILMTAFATIFALIPLALSSSTSGLISKGLAVTVIGGLTTSTLLTLIFVPVLYATVGKYRKNLSTDL